MNLADPALKESAADIPMNLTAEQIEWINAHGPYLHSVWRSGSLRVGNEDQLSGRVEFLARKIKETLLRRFSLDQIRAFSILDVGCYDGSLLHQLEDLPFARMVGVEPRERNLRKGRMVRELLKIPTRVEFRQGDLDSLDVEEFDVVLCVGVLYHVGSLPSAVARLRSACRKILFIESICLSSRYLTPALKQEMEMKDLIYWKGERMCGLTGQKLESDLLDGSTHKTGVVSIPTLESLKLYLDLSGFGPVEILVDPPTYHKQVLKGQRPIEAVCLCTEVRPEAPLSDWPKTAIADYERGLIQAVLPRKVLEPLYRVLCLRQRWVPLSWLSLLILLSLKWSGRTSKGLASLLKLQLRDADQFEIVKNLKFSPGDKIRLEYGKLLVREGNFEEALRIFREITQKINADWRSVYRAFYWLSQVYGRLGQEEQNRWYGDLLKTCCPSFPVDGIVEEMRDV
ncbi:MAG: class I SAM-dependent methyltransferase [Candidatus Omnitrophica bacterium]|nr:class I SAM-dependent methyltransferase [Candidatus Omnitrophota bacterium]